LREVSDRAELAARVASTLEFCCADSELDLGAAQEALEAESMAWLVLCDRGWPSTVRPAPEALTAARDWMASWSELVNLPVAAGAAPSANSGRHRDIRLTLFLCELKLRPALPEAVWAVVGPLNPTGQATLACLLQALATWVEAHTKALAAAERTRHLRERFDRVSRELAAVGLQAPDNPLDIRMWRAVAASARAIAAA
jgi:hypothetical protein